MRAWPYSAALALVLCGCNFVVDGVMVAGPEAGDDLAINAPGDDLAAPSDSDLATTSIDMTMPTTTTGLLSGTLVKTADNLNLDLSAEGTRDWAHWGTTTNASFDHKNLAASLISNVTLLGGSATQFGTYAVGWSWSDGTPTAMATNSTTGIYNSGNGNGFRIVVPADTTTRTLRVYLGGQTAKTTLTAHLSDGAAADYTASTQPAAGDGTQYERTVTLTYRALSAGQTLRVDWVQSSGNGFVHLHSATLQ